MSTLQIKKKAAIAALPVLLACSGWLPALAADPLPGRDADGSIIMGTRTGSEVFGTDPETGDRLTSTPEQERDDQNSTYPLIIVPEINVPMPWRSPDEQPPQPLIPPL